MNFSYGRTDGRTDEWFNLFKFKSKTRCRNWTMARVGIHVRGRLGAAASIRKTNETWIVSGRKLQQQKQR